MTNKALVCDAVRVIAGHLVTRLKREGFWVRGVDPKFHEHSESEADDFAKVAETSSGSSIEVWGDGNRAPLFLFAEECTEGSTRLIRPAWAEPINIGSEEMVTINRLAETVADIAQKQIRKAYIPGPQGVRGRNSDNRLIRQALRWEPTLPLRAGLEAAYPWIEARVHRNSAGASV